MDADAWAGCTVHTEIVPFPLQQPSPDLSLMCARPVTSAVGALLAPSCPPPFPPPVCAVALLPAPQVPLFSPDAADREDDSGRCLMLGSFSPAGGTLAVESAPLGAGVGPTPPACLGTPVCTFGAGLADPWRGKTDSEAGSGVSPDSSPSVATCLQGG